MQDVMIAEACRTTIGSFGGNLKPLDMNDLTVSVIKSASRWTGLDPLQVNEVALGHCRQSPDMSNTAQYIAFRAGIPEEVPANTVTYACAPGMLAVNNAVSAIRTEQTEVVLAGGTESMSNAIFHLSDAKWGVGTGTTQLKDPLTGAQLCSQPRDIYGRLNMGTITENVAAKMGITRDKQDQFALASQQKVVVTIASGRFRNEIIPLAVPQGRRKEPTVFDVGELPWETSPEKLTKLKPTFPDGGTVAAGNSSGRNDGAPMLALMNGQKTTVLGLNPLALVHGILFAGVDPAYMGLGPVLATRKILKQTGLSLNDTQLVELNEAFAVQPIGCIRELHPETRMDVISVNSGAIAFRHPIGSSGNRVLVTLVHELCKRELKYGLATLCIAGGMGMVTATEVL